MPMAGYSPAERVRVTWASNHTAQARVGHARQCFFGPAGHTFVSSPGKQPEGDILGPEAQPQDCTQRSEWSTVLHSIWLQEKVG